MSELQVIEGERTEVREPRIKLVPFDKITLGTERRYLVKGIVPREGVTVVWGPPKSGKSFWTFDMVMHVAMDWPYRGRRVHPGPVVYCAFEGQSGVRNRVEAFRQRHLSEDASGVPFYLQPVTLDLVKDHLELCAVIQATLGTKQPPVAVVLDTLNRSLQGSESSDQDMGAYIKAADAIREMFNCAVLIVHHSGIEASRPRGHTSLTGAADAQIKISRDAGGTIEATVEWMKDGPEGDTIASKLEQVEIGFDEDGEAITSCVVVECERTVSAATTKGAKLTSAERTGLAALREAIECLGTIPPPSNQIPANTPTVTEDQWRKYAYLRKISAGGERAMQQAFKRAHGGLIAKGQISAWQDQYWIAG